MPEKRTYYVEAPLVGKVTGYVEAVSKEQAIELLVNAAWNVQQPELHEGQDISDLDFGELEIMRQVNQGNVCYAPIGEAYAEEA